MGKVISMAGTLLLFLSMATAAWAGSQVLTFDTNNWGTGTWGAYNTIRNFEASGGNPGACLLLKGISGVGASFSNTGLTGDFAAAGYGQIAFDIKVKHWFPRQGQPAPVAYVFMRGGNTRDPWCKEIHGFAPVTTSWKRYAVEFNPSWSDTEANAQGWKIIHFPGTTETSTFKDTVQNVFQTGMWIKVMDAGAECHVWLDNYSLLPGSGSSQLKLTPFKRQKKTIMRLPAN